MPHQEEDELRGDTPPPAEIFYSDTSEHPTPRRTRSGNIKCQPSDTDHSSETAQSPPRKRRRVLEHRPLPTHAPGVTLTAIRITTIILTLLAYVNGTSWRDVQLRYMCGVGPRVPYRGWRLARGDIEDVLTQLVADHREFVFEQLRLAGKTSVRIMMDATFPSRFARGGSQQGTLTWGIYGPADHQYDILGVEVLDHSRWRGGVCYHVGNFDEASGKMEAHAAAQVANLVMDAGFNIEALCHDRCASAFNRVCQACEARGRPCPLERLDWGHESKNIWKRFNKRAGAIKQMAERVKNHFLHSIQEAAFDLRAFRVMWGRGLLHFGGCHARCAHGAIDEDAMVDGHPLTRKYLCPAVLNGPEGKLKEEQVRHFNFLVKQFKQTSEDAPMMVDRASTNCLESLHSSIHHCAPKFKDFPKSYRSRIMLAALARQEGRGTMLVLVLTTMGIDVPKELMEYAAELDSEHGSQARPKRRPAGSKRKAPKEVI